MCGLGFNRRSKANRGGSEGGGGSHLDGMSLIRRNGDAADGTNGRVGGWGKGRGGVVEEKGRGVE